MNGSPAVKSHFQSKKPIRYPEPLRPGGRIGVTAPSSGVEEHLHILLHRAREQVQKAGYQVVEGETIWTEDKLVSAPKEKRAAELSRFLEDDSIDVIIPPWGGWFLMEVLPLLDWKKLSSLPPKWILGYSDTSTLLFTYTLLTGNATAHGPNWCELSAPEWDEVTGRWTGVLATPASGMVTQVSSEKYQSSWEWVYRNPASGFAFDTPTEWKVLGREKRNESPVKVSGRLLGGCLEALIALAGTPFAPVERFVIEHVTDEEGVLWYLETDHFSAAQIYRALWQMKGNGWFTRISGALFGRPKGFAPTKNFGLKDALEQIFAPMNIPVLYDVDIGHMPPQMTLVNGALAEVTVEAGRGTLTMRFVP
jgi:muramoyltetrapeptide carboxypeptidase LdcA involved in peptidoglycan recycling